MKETPQSSSQSQEKSSPQVESQEAFGLEAPDFVPFIQTKLSVGASDDPLEREADEMAEQLISPSPDFPNDPPPSISEKSTLRRKHLSSANQSKSNSISSPTVNSAFQDKLNQTKGQGSPLPTPIRAEMEGLFGNDFKDVTIHSGSKAEELSSEIQAKAFTQGNSIFFNKGEYRPKEQEGRKLIAHELTHVVQQGGSESSKLIQRTEDETSQMFIHRGAYDPAARNFFSKIKSTSNYQEGSPLVVQGRNGIVAYSAEGDRVVSRPIQIKFLLPPGTYYLMPIITSGRGSAGFTFHKVLSNGSHQAFINGGGNIPIELYPAFRDAVGFQQFYLVIPGSKDGIQREASGEGQQNRRGAPNWAMRKYRAVKSRIEQMKSLSQAPPLPGDIILLRSDPDGDVGRLNIWLNAPVQRRRRKVHAGPRGQVRFRRNQSVEEIVAEVLQVTLRLQNQQGEDQKDQDQPDDTQLDGERPKRFRGFGTEFGKGGDSTKRFAFPPLPARIVGLKAQPEGGTGVFTMRLNYSFADRSLLGQVSWAFLNTYYRWEVWDITEAANTKQKEEEIRRGKLGSEEQESTQGEAIKGNFARAIDDLNQRPGQIRRDRREALQEGRYLDVIANELNEDLLALEATMRLGREVLGAGADLLSDGQERSIYWPKKGIFVIRCIAVINPKEPTRAPSVATLVVSVDDVEQLSKEAIDAPSEDVAMLKMQLALLQQLPQWHPDRNRIPELEKQLEERKLFATGDPIRYIRYQLEEKQKELKQAEDSSYLLKSGIYDGRVVSLRREVDTLKDQLSLAEKRSGELYLASGRNKVQRVHGVLVSKVTGQTYPLLLQIGEPTLVGNQWICRLSDVTSRDGARYSGSAPNQGEPKLAKLTAVERALKDLAGNAGYGDGSLTFRLPEEGWFSELSPAQRNIHMESYLRDWAAAKARLEELGQVIAILGLVVTNPAIGIAGGILSATLAADRLVSRWQNGTFRWDSQAVGDVIDLLSFAIPLADKAIVGALEKLPKSGGGFVLRTARKGLTLGKKAAGVADEAVDILGEIHTNAETVNRFMEIEAAVRDGSMTRTQARRERASLIASQIQNQGVQLIGAARGHFQRDPNVPRRRPEIIGGDAAADAPRRRQRQESQSEQVNRPQDSRQRAKSDASGTSSTPKKPSLGQRLLREFDSVSLREPHGTPASPARLRKSGEKVQIEVGGKVYDVVETGESGNGVAVRYGERRMILEVNADADLRHIGNHVETMRQLQKYEGVIGSVRILISQVKQMLGLGLAYDSKGFEAGMESKKLNRILKDLERIRDRIDDRAKKLSEDDTGALARNEAERAAIDQEISGIKEQLGRHSQDLYSTARGSGRIAAENTGRDFTKMDIETLRQHAPSSDKAMGELRSRYETLGREELERRHYLGDEIASQILGRRAVPDYVAVENLEREQIADQLERERQMAIAQGTLSAKQTNRSWLLENSRMSPPNPNRFVVREYNFKRIASILDGSALKSGNGVRQRLQAENQGGRLPQVDTSVLHLPVIQFVFQDRSTFAAFRELIVEMDGIAKSQGQLIYSLDAWRGTGGLKQFLGNIDNQYLGSMLHILVDENLSVTDVRKRLGINPLNPSGGTASAGGSGTVGNARPDYVDFDLAQGNVTAIDVTTNIGNIGHKFKTRFYVGVLRRILGEQGPTVSGQESLRTIDPSSRRGSPRLSLTQDEEVD